MCQITTSQTRTYIRLHHSRCNVRINTHNQKKMEVTGAHGYMIDKHAGRQAFSISHPSMCRQSIQCQKRGDANLIRYLLCDCKIICHPAAGGNIFARNARQPKVVYCAHQKTLARPRPPSPPPPPLLLRTRIDSLKRGGRSRVSIPQIVIYSRKAHWHCLLLSHCSRSLAHWRIYVTRKLAILYMGRRIQIARRRRTLRVEHRARLRARIASARVYSRARRHAHAATR